MGKRSKLRKKKELTALGEELMVKKKSVCLDDRIESETKEDGLKVDKLIKDHDKKEALQDTHSNGKAEVELSVRGREYFIHSVCQLCKEVLNANTRDPCRRCTMVAYCGADHRRRHWPVHSELCSAICQLGGKEILEEAPIGNADSFRKFCFGLIEGCRKNLGRHLEQWEMEILLYPRVCEHCYAYNKGELIICEVCLHSCFCCDKHKHQRRHDTHCTPLIQYRECMSAQYRNSEILPSIPRIHLNSRFQFINGNIEELLKKTDRNVSEPEYLQLSEIVSGPLTAGYAICKSSKAERENAFLIHVVGAEMAFEGNRLEKWELFLLHHFPNLKALTIVFIGPELNNEGRENLELCLDCRNQNRVVQFEYIDKTLYHDYAASKGYVKPDLICAFNAGIYRTTGYNGEDTWPETINSMLKTSEVPVLVTAYTSKESKMDLQRIRKVIGDGVIEVIAPSKNPFSSRKPNLNLVSYEETPVIYKNYFLFLVKRKK